MTKGGLSRIINSITPGHGFLSSDVVILELEMIELFNQISVLLGIDQTKYVSSYDELGRIFLIVRRLWIILVGLHHIGYTCILKMH